MALFMRSVGLPPAMIGQMRQAPMWASMEAIAPTLAYDAAVMGDNRVPSDLANVKIPTLVLTGSETGPWAPAAAQAVADALPYCRHVVLQGQDHNVSWDALLPHLMPFLD
ncbi:hypothetical protein ACIBI9_17330 [Nonomuraea sp. NPDC050451]|uniref:hypothetical protein n=1 Tax=Nonomuraea sp. NPDC050451 TaxID=3364364 RepID=UPI0037BC5661